MSTASNVNVRLQLSKQYTTLVIFSLGALQCMQTSASSERNQLNEGMQCQVCLLKSLNGAQVIFASDVFNEPSILRTL